MTDDIDPSLTTPVTGASAGAGDAPSTDSGPTPARWRRWRTWTVIMAVCAAAGSAGVFLLPTPYYLYEPGSVRPTTTRITISGHQAFDSDGAVYFPTVGISRATPAGLVQGLLDDRVDVQSRDEAYPDGDVQRDRIANRRMMESSKLDATYVAFRTVGYPVIVTGSGAFVDEVMPGFPASSVFRQGDVITAIDGQEVTTVADLRPRLLDRPVGAEVIVTIRRPGVERPFDELILLGANAEDPSRGYLGVTVSTADEGLDLPFGVDIDSGTVTGPSAGLAWALGLIDRLTPGDLTGGRQVVATGEIRSDGAVGTIGGIEQKMAAIVRGGYDVFLYPEGTPASAVRELERMADGRVELHPVGHIDDALAILAPDGLPPAPPLS